MAFPGFNRSNDPDAGLKREYLDAIRVLNKAAEHSEAAAKAQERVVNVEKVLIEKGHQTFTARTRVNADVYDKFFGDLGTTRRGQAFVAATQAKNVAGNAMGVVKEDLIGFLTGSDKASKAAGLAKNNFLSRALGAEKFFSPGAVGEKESPVIDKVGRVLLEKIEKNTDMTVKALKGVEKATNDFAEEQLREGEQKRIVHDGSTIHLDDKTGQKKLGGISGAIEAATGGLMETIAGVATGSALAPLITTALTKVPVLAAIGSIVGGVLWAAVDGIGGYLKSGEWGASKTSSVIGAALAGTNKDMIGAFAGAGKFALIGAGIGSIVPVVGTLAGGLVGAAVGAVMGWFGGERMAKMLDESAAAIGKWSDQIFGTTFQTDPAALEKNLKTAQEKSDENSKKAADFADKINDIDAQIAKARADGDVNLRNRLQSQRDLLVQGRMDAEKASAKSDEELLKAEKELKDSKQSFLEAQWESLKRDAIRPLGMLADVVFGTSMTLDAEAEKKNLEDAKTAVKDLGDKVAGLDAQIAKNADDLRKAMMAGDDGLVAALKERADSLEKRRDEAESDRKDALLKLQEAGSALFFAEHKIVDMISDGFTAATDYLGSLNLKDSIVDMTKEIGAWFKQIFSWKYWSGSIDKNGDVKPTVAPPAPPAATDGRKPSYLLSDTDGARERKDLTDQFMSGKIDIMTLREKLKALDEKKNSGEPMKSLSGDSSGTPTVAPRETSAQTMTETNAIQEETRRSEVAASAKQQASTIATVMNSTTVVNNNATAVNLDVTNRDPSFAAGYAGSRNISYGD